MITKKAILSLIEHYVDTKDIVALSHSFAPLFYDIEETGEAEAIPVAYEIEAALAAVSAGVSNDTEFLLSMKTLLGYPSISVSEPKAEFVISSQDVLMPNSFTFTAAEMASVHFVSFDTEPVAESGSGLELQDKLQTNTAPPPLLQMLGG